MYSKKVTINDLARELNLSASTVSRALRNEPRISSKTRLTVQNLANQYGYCPNPHAQGLVKKKSRLLGVILPTVDMPYFTRILDGIIQTAASAGYQIISSISHNKCSEEKEAIKNLLEKRVDGILAVYAGEDEDFSAYQQIIDDDIPLIFLDRHTEELDSSYVISDDFKGALMAVEYLLSKGYKRIAHIHGPKAISISFYRFLGYKQALEKAGLKVEEDLVFQSHDGLGSQIQDLDRLKATLPEIDAIFAFNDNAAYEILKIIKAMNLSVPEDVALMGYTDEPIAKYLSPQLSTIRQPAFEIGKVATQKVVKYIQYKLEDDEFLKRINPISHEVIRLDNELIIRESA